MRGRLSWWEQSRQLLDKADVIVCEWCVGNAVWYSKEKRPDQKKISVTRYT